MVPEEMGPIGLSCPRHTTAAMAATRYEWVMGLVMQHEWSLIHFLFLFFIFWPELESL